MNSISYENLRGDEHHEQNTPGSVLSTVSPEVNVLRLTVQPLVEVGKRPSTSTVCMNLVIEQINLLRLHAPVHALVRFQRTTTSRKSRTQRVRKDGNIGIKQTTLKLPVSGDRTLVITTDQGFNERGIPKKTSLMTTSLNSVGKTVIWLLYEVTYTWTLLGGTGGQIAWTADGTCNHSCTMHIEPSTCMAVQINGRLSNDTRLAERQRAEQKLAEQQLAEQQLACTAFRADTKGRQSELPPLLSLSPYTSLFNAADPMHMLQCNTLDAKQEPMNAYPELLPRSVTLPSSGPGSSAGPPPPRGFRVKQEISNGDVGPPTMHRHPLNPMAELAPNMYNSSFRFNPMVPPPPPQMYNSRFPSFPMYNPALQPSPRSGSGYAPNVVRGQVSHDNSAWLYMSTNWPPKLQLRPVPQSGTVRSKRKRSSGCDPLQPEQRKLQCVMDVLASVVTTIGCSSPLSPEVIRTGPRLRNMY
jgi:hypothetical protein